MQTIFQHRLSSPRKGKLTFPSLSWSTQWHFLGGKCRPFLVLLVTWPKWGHACDCAVISVVSNSLNPMDCSLPGSSVHGILQARILEWVAISFSRGSSRPRNWTWLSCLAGRFFTNWAAREAHSFDYVDLCWQSDFFYFYLWRCVKTDTFDTVLYRPLRFYLEDEGEVWCVD